LLRDNRPIRRGFADKADGINFGGDGTRSSAGHGSSQISARDFDMSGMSTRDQAVAARNASRQLQVRPARAPGGPTTIITPP
jgi:hypothetical protein